MGGFYSKKQDLLLDDDIDILLKKNVQNFAFYNCDN